MERLTKGQWLDHGLARLAQDGPSALKADKLAKSIGASRGSFYWHFNNLADFHESLLNRWLELTVDTVVDQLDALDDPRDRLEHLITIASHPTVGVLERAVRGWALGDDAVQKSVAQVDAQRIAYVTACLDELSPADPTTMDRALFIYMASIGHAMLDADVSERSVNGIIAQAMHVVDAST